jgi:hypothetical protein
MWRLRVIGHGLFGASMAAPQKTSSGFWHVFISITSCRLKGSEFFQLCVDLHRVGDGEHFLFVMRAQVRLRASAPAIRLRRGPY